MQFDLISKDPKSGARAGLLHTDHGQVETPIFMPVGTAATVKGVHFEELENEIEAQIILGNTYHLYLRPGTEILQQAGGIHKFNSWNKPTLTDSGGYQVYSLADRRKITEEGATFQSHIDGSKHLFTPESVMDIQRQIGADIIMAFDECPPWPCEEKYADDSMQMTHRWLTRCIQRLKETAPLYNYSQTLFPIVQGSCFPELRKKSAYAIAEAEQDGNAIGGLSVGEPAEEMYAMTDLVCSILPKEKPRYLMGVGTPVNILECIALGIDMFDCVMPSRNGRNGMLFTWNGIMNMRNRKWANDHSPVDPEGPVSVTRRHTKAYLRHLTISQEMLSAQICSLHNLGFYLELVSEARKHILTGDFSSWKNSIVPKLATRL